MNQNEINSAKSPTPLATVLPYRASLFRQTHMPGGRVAHTYQESFLPWLVGEYLRLGATRIAIPADDPTSGYINDLPDKLRSCITIVDKDEQVLKRVQALMEPIVNEIPVQFPWGEYFPTATNPSDPAIQSVITVRTSLRKLLLGLRYRLQVDLDINETKKGLLVLRDALRSQDALINTNQFLGILNSYQIEDVHSLVFVSNLAEDRVREFEEMLDDELFRQLSEKGYFLGVPGMIRKCIWEIKEIAAKIVRARAKPLLQLAATPVNVATGGWADVSAAADLLPESKPSFLPPIAWFSAEHMTARTRFEAREVPTEPDPTGKYRLMPGQFKESDIEILVKTAREVLGARLKTHYENGEPSTDSKDDDSHSKK